MAAAGLGFWDGESPGPESGVPESQALEAVKLALELGQRRQRGHRLRRHADRGRRRKCCCTAIRSTSREFGDRGAGRHALGRQHRAARRGAARRRLDRQVPRREGRARRRAEQAGVDAAAPSRKACSWPTPRKRWPSTIALLQELESQQPNGRAEQSGARSRMSPLSRRHVVARRRCRGCSTASSRQAADARRHAALRRQRPRRPRHQPGADQALLRLLSQRAAARGGLSPLALDTLDFRTCGAHRRRSGRRWSQAADRRRCRPCGRPAARRGDVRRAGDLARERARSRRGRSPRIPASGRRCIG